MPPVAAAFAAVAAGTATVAAVGTVISTVGMGLMVVGKITGDETLTKIGGVMSLAGGITSIAGGMMGAAEGAAGAASSAAAEGAVDAAVGESVTGAMDSGIGFGDAAASAAEGASTATQGISGMNSPNSFSDARFSGDISSPSAPSFSDARFDAQQASGTTNGGGLINASQPTQQMSIGNSTDNASIKSDLMYQDNAPADTSSSGIREWFNKQPERTKNAILQMGGKALGGIYDGWSQEQKLALERERYNLAQSNANAQPTVNFKPVAGQTRPIGGLINARTA